MSNYTFKIQYNEKPKTLSIRNLFERNIRK